MPDTPIGPSPHTPELEFRVTKLEHDFADIETLLVRTDATLTATLPHLATKAEMQAGFAELNGKIAGVEGKVAGLDGRLDGVEAIVGGLDGKVVGLDGKAASLDGKVAGLDEKIGGVSAKIAGLDAKVDVVNGKIGELRTGMRSGDAAIRSEFLSELHSELGKLQADLAEKPGKTYLWMVLGAPIMAYAAGLAGLAVLK